MANGTRLSILFESLKECQGALTQQQAKTTAFQKQQQTHNTAFHTQLHDITEMLCTLIANQNRPPHECPPLADPLPFHLPFVPGLNHRFPGQDGRDDRCRDHDEHRNGWHLRDEQQLCDGDELPDAYREDMLLQPRPLRLDFPCFEGDNPASWTYKVNQLFEYDQTILYQCVRMASFHMEGEALIWFQDADESGQFSTWDAFVQTLLTRFGPVYNDPMEALMHLHQSSSVAEYTAQFEALSNRLHGIS